MRKPCPLEVLGYQTFVESRRKGLKMHREVPFDPQRGGGAGGSNKIGAQRC